MNDNTYLDRLLNLYNTGYILDQNDGVVDHKDMLALKEGCSPYVSKSSREITFWEPNNFDMEATTIWSFPQRGDWASHNSRYRGNWSPYIPRNIILRYSEVGDCVLDQFLGSGTTLIEAKLLNRRGFGIDINQNALRIAKGNLDFQKSNSFEPVLRQGTAVDLNFIENKCVDLICTHPPYANIMI